jgi:KDO2-lipid IV(A) lauroyltransferase
MWWAVDPGRRRNARMNYAAALGVPETDPEAVRVARRAFANYGCMLADFLLIGGLTPEKVRSMITIDGRENVDAAHALGRGTILALPHMGSYDIAGSMAGIWGYRIAAVAETLPGSLNDVVVETRSLHGLEIIPMARAAVRAINAVLDENGLVALLCDLPHGPGVEVTLLGHRAIVPSGVATIACRRGTPIVPAFCRRTESRGYHIHIDAPIAPPPPDRSRDKAAMAGLMQQVVDRFGEFIRSYPDQWYAFRRILQ